VETFRPEERLLRKALGVEVQDFSYELIKTTLPWSLVFRVTLYTQGHSTYESVIVKAIDPKGPHDPLDAERELCFYQNSFPNLSHPKPIVHLLSIDDRSGWYVIVMEDLSSRYRIPRHPYQWTSAELKSVLRAYAILHTTPISLSQSWLNPRHESQLDFEAIPEQVARVQRAGIWGSLPGLPTLIAYARESCKKYERASICLLHNDTTPTNAPLPMDLDSEPALLIDWQDVGIGMSEMDLAYMDLQPFDSARIIPRHELLKRYWSFRAVHKDDIPSATERKNRQLHADLVMALWLTRPASRVALHPYPEGTYPHMHWNSQFDIVYNRLKELTDEINL
jgi:hypothetical protein